YPAAGWSYPSGGRFQVYTVTAKQASRSGMTAKYGSLRGINSAGGLNLTSGDQISPPNEGDGFYTKGGYKTAEGKAFLSWNKS
ncbi:family 14 glycosylhydrolase, partial [Paenibacillus sp. GbtcB18]|uniref:family 14 glycosylhydrolase n=1 Tax=Paenibacillus sp. GbtcB18 TaxID=2824763 RepID=UPI001C30B71A